MTGKENKHIQLANLEIGGEKPVLIAGPCSIESRDHIVKEAEFLKDLDIDIIRGGAYKPRTSPDSFQGIGFEGVKYLRQAADMTGLPMITEVLSEDDIEKMEDYVDIFQVGSRNMYNYALLKKLGKTNKPVMLKRGFSASIREWASAAEYIEKGGNDQIIFCERGIRTFERSTRNTLDLMGAYLLKEKTSRPVIIDPSHGTGRRDLILPACRAALAMGFDGVMVEVHPNPDKALSDGDQTLDYESFKELAQEWRKICK